MNDLVEWKPTWDLGIELIDSEHKRLIALLRRLQQEVRGDSPYLKSSVHALLSEVTNHLSTHFMHEETLIAKYATPKQLSDHTYAHRRWRQMLLEESAKLRLELDSEDLQQHAQHFVEGVIAFFTNHFENHDCLMREICTDCSLYS